MRIVFLGMECAGSEIVLRALLAAGFDVRGVVLGGWGAADEAEPGPMAALARAAGVATVPIGRAGELAGVVAELEGRPDALVAACFPWRVPSAVRVLPRLGCLNVHPSLLPAGRGPEPVFWALRRGERRTGATVHVMDAGFDTGPVVSQADLDVPAGVRAPELEARLMALGGDLLVDALPRLAAGELAGTPQDEALATAAPPPTAADWAMSTTLPAGWAWRFARGVAPLGGPLAVLVGASGERIPVRDALDHDPAAGLAAATVWKGEGEGAGVVRVRFRPGWVRFAAER